MVTEDLSIWLKLKESEFDAWKKGWLEQAANILDDYNKSFPPGTKIQYRYHGRYVHDGTIKGIFLELRTYGGTIYCSVSNASSGKRHRVEIKDIIRIWR